jgi:hypothetical protein
MRSHSFDQTVVGAPPELADATMTEKQSAGEEGDFGGRWRTEEGRASPNLSMPKKRAGAPLPLLLLAIGSHPIGYSRARLKGKYLSLIFLKVWSAYN